MLVRPASDLASHRSVCQIVGVTDITTRSIGDLCALMVAVASHLLQMVDCLVVDNDENSVPADEESNTLLATIVSILPVQEFNLSHD